MTDGHWTIKQYAPNSKTGFTVTVIPVTLETGKRHDGTTQEWLMPVVERDETVLTVRHHDRTEHYPWASIVHAEYQPPNPQEGGTQ